MNTMETIYNQVGQDMLTSTHHLDWLINETVQEYLWVCRYYNINRPLHIVPIPDENNIIVQKLEVLRKINDDIDCLLRNNGRY